LEIEDLPLTAMDQPKSLVGEEIMMASSMAELGIYHWNELSGKKL